MKLQDINNPFLNDLEWELLKNKFGDYNFGSIVIELDLLKDYSYDVALQAEDYSSWLEYDHDDIKEDKYSLWVVEACLAQYPGFLNNITDYIKKKQLAYELGGYVYNLGKFPNRNDFSLRTQILFKENLDTALNTINFKHKELLPKTPEVKCYAFNCGENILNKLGIEYQFKDCSIQELLDILKPQGLVSDFNYDKFYSLQDKLSHYKITFNNDGFVSSKMYLLYIG